MTPDRPPGEPLGTAGDQAPEPADTARPLRCFFAALPDEPTQRRVQALQRDLLARLGHRHLRAVRPRALHVTLAFLGEQPRDRVDALCAAAEGFGGELSAFDASVTVWRLLPERRRPRVVALGLASAGVLEALASHARGLAAREGAVLEPRAFIPHLTLLRTRRLDARRLGDAVPELDLRFDRLALLSSRLAHSGAVYDALWSRALPD